MLSCGNLAHEISLLLLEVGREAFILRAFNGLLNYLALHGALSLCLLLHGSCHTPVIPLQGFPEFGVRLSLMVKVNGIDWKKGETVTIQISLYCIVLGS